MKKKMLSLLLVMAMLLSIVPMAGATGEAAEQKFTGYNLYLQNSIAIEFEANRAAIEEGFEKVEFYIGEELVQTRTTLPEADENGNVSFRCTKLTPAQMGEDVTAKLYIDGDIKHEFSTSVKDYCMYILNDAETYSDPELRTMLVDLLNYGAATQTFANAGTTLVNADLGDYAELATAGDLELTNVCEIFEYSNVTDPTVSWYGVGLNLKDSITLCYEFVADSIENLAIHFFNDDYSLDAWVTNFEQVEGTENHYYAYFGMLNPTQLSETISAVAYTDHNSSNRHMESHKLLYSAESYAYAVANGTYSAELMALTDAMMRYGDAVRRWNCDHGEYKNGRCAVCEMEKVFEMTTDTITIQAEDAILNMTGTKDSVDRIMENPNAAGGKIVKMQATYSAYADKTAATVEDGINYEGSIIVKFIPKLSGTYTVSARVIDNGGALGGMVAAEDDIATTYTRQGITETSAGLNYDGFMTTDQFVSGLIGSSYKFTAGKTYAIRILSTTDKLAFDEFVITHVHTYDDDNDPTCNGCGEGRHVHTKVINSDDTYHWYEYTCGCTDLDDSKVEHTYTNGVCECGKERVFVMDGTSITINAQDAVLNTDYVSLISNNNVTGRQLVQLTNGHSAYINSAYVTSAEHPGDVVVYVTPSESGTYSVVAKIVCTKKSTITGVMIEDISTEGTKYTYLALTEDVVSNPANFTTGNITEVAILGDQEWIAGHTYAIRIAAGNTRTALDQFVITAAS